MITIYDSLKPIDEFEASIPISAHEKRYAVVGSRFQRDRRYKLAGWYPDLETPREVIEVDNYHKAIEVECLEYTLTMSITRIDP